MPAAGDSCLAALVRPQPGGAQELAVVGTPVYDGVGIAGGDASIRADTGEIPRIGPRTWNGGAAMIVLRGATEGDLGGMEGLLEGARLPTVGVGEALGAFVVAEADGVVVGVAGLEVHGRDGLLRSVVVAPSLQQAGLGRRLTERVLAEARRSGLRRVYLLTETAADYFTRYGFRPIAREDASTEVQGSVEFREACPASAVAMVLELE
jgi:amino-acid N-acetyltransferase